MKTRSTSYSTARSIMLMLAYIFVSTVTLSQSIPSYVPTNGLVGWWPFNGNANDESGNGNHGVVNGAVLTPDRFGFSAKAYSFNGTSNFISIPYSPLFNLTTSLSISAWVNRNSASNMSFISRARISTSTVSYQLSGLNGNLGFGVNNDPGACGNACNLGCGPTNNLSGTWNLYTGTWDGSTLKFYLNGVLVSTCNGTLGSTGQLIANNYDILIGKWPNNSFYFGGKLDDIGIWNRALSASEIQQVYQSQAPCNLASNFFDQDSISGCGNLITLNAGNSAATYSWNTGATTQSINVNNTGWYRCTVSQGTTCSVTDSVYVSLPNSLPANLQTGLVGYWPFCGNANDESGNSRHGVVSGAILSTDRTGSSNKAYGFDGANDLITVAHDASFNFTNFSVSCWVLKDNQSLYIPGIISKCQTNNFGWYLVSNANQLDSITFQGYQFGAGWSANAAPIPPQQWMHILGTFAPGMQKLYVNGTLVSSKNSPLNLFNTNEDIRIGFKNGDSYWGGKIDDLGLWNRVLTASEIQQLYQNQSPCTLSSNFFAQDTLSGCGNLITLNAGNTGATYSWNTGATTQTTNVNSTGWYRCTVSQGTTCSVTDSVYVSLPNALPANLQTGLVGYWPFCGNANDESGNGNNGTVNGATLTTDRFENLNQSYFFDGVNDYINCGTFGQINGITTATFNAWIKVKSKSNYSRILGKELETGIEGVNMKLSGPDDLSSNLFEFTSNIRTGSSLPTIYSGVVPDTSSWYMISMVYDGTAISNQTRAKFYVNGLLTNNTFTGTIPNSLSSNLYSFWIGGINPTPTMFPFHGKIDDVCVWNRALTPTEIQQLYQNQSPCTLTSNFFTLDTLSGCGNLITLNTGNAGATYSWNTGSTTQSINVNSTGWYRCTVSQGITCSVTDSIYISLPNSLPANLQTGLVGYWPFCGNANDESGNGNNGVVNGAVLTSDRKGQSSTAYAFNGASSGISLINNTIPVGNASRSISVWFKMNLPLSNPNYSSLIRLGNNTTGQRIGLQYGNSSLIVEFVTSTVSIPFSVDSSWHQIVVTYPINGTGSNSILIYLDGALVSNYSYWQPINILNTSANPSNGLTYSIGELYNLPGYFWDGKLDDIGIWNRALSASEIQQLFQSQSPCTLSSNFFSQDTLSGCGNLITLNAGNTGATYSWNTGATTQLINVNNTGWYRCTVSQGTTCSATDSVYISLPNALPSSLQTGLVGYWPFCGNANDESGNGNNGVVNGAISTTNRFGTSSSAYQFSSGNNITINDNATLRLANTNFTVNSWVYLTDTLPNAVNYGQYAILSKRDISNTTYDYLFGVSAPSNTVSYGSGRPVFSTTNLTGGFAVAPSPIPLNQWTSLSASYEITGGILKLYANGNLLTTANGVPPPSATVTANLWIGNDVSGQPYHFHGKLDDIGIWNRALTPTEIQQLYQSQSPCSLTTNFFSQDTLSGCGNIITLNAGNAGATYAWNTGATTQSIDVNSTGWYRCTVSQGSICVTTDSVYVTFLNAQISTPDTTICIGNTVTLNLSGNNTITAPNPNQQLYSITKTFTGPWTINFPVNPQQNHILRINGFWSPYGCPNTYDAAYTYANPQCQFLQNCSTYVGGWSVVGYPGLRPSNDVCGGNQGFYYYNIPAGNSTVSINYSDNPYTDNIGSLTYTLFRGESYLWSTGATTPSINVSPTQTTTYYVTVSNGISSCVDSVTVTVLPNTTWYADGDGDGYGSALDTLSGCTGAPAGYVGNNTDCNDLSATAYPGAAELCNSIDDDCDNLVDEGLAPVIGPVTGAGVQCIPLAPGSATFSIDPVPGATDYFWTAPAGTSITSANDTTSVTIAWNSANAHDGISGPLTVTVTGACGQLSSTQTIDIHLQISVPVRPASISGPVKLCPGDSATFSTASVSRARSYTWSVPPGINIVDGQGSNILRVVATAGFQGGTIAVSATNSCGTGPARSKTIGFNVPSTPGSISGTAAGLCGLQDIIYSVSSQTGITQYLWTAPAGTQLSGSGNSIQLDFDNTFANGNLSVVAINGCGTSLVRNLALTGYPARPGSIAGPLNLCPGSTAAYGVGTVNGTSSYTWTPISGATGLIGQGTKNISFTAPATSSTNNNLSVAASNGCGSSAVRSLGGITVDPAFCVRMGTKATTANISAYPNPAQDILFLKAEGIIPQRIEVYNMLGECVLSGPWNTTLNLKTISNGLYILRARGTTDAVVRIEIMRD